MRLAGRRYDLGGRDGFVEITDGRIVDEGAGRPGGGVDVRGLILPGFVNAHTHLGDAFLRGRIDGVPLSELVRFPDGLKHRELRATPRDEIVRGIRTALGEAAQTGTTHVIDFREGGVDGLGVLAAAADDGPGLVVHALGRPAAPAFSDTEAREVAEEAAGLAPSSVADVGLAAAARLAREARRTGRLFAIHHSEEAREPLDDLLSLRPDFVVHMTCGAPADFERLADAGIPVVVCPRSNARFGRRPPVAAMKDAGVDVFLGTDNAMFHPVDLLAEARFLLSECGGLAPDDVVGAMTEGPRKLLNKGEFVGPIRAGAIPDLVVLPDPGGDPAKAALSATRILWGPNETPNGDTP